MKKRFLLLNLAVFMLFLLLTFAYYSYSQMHDIAIGSSALAKLQEREQVGLDKLATIKISVYSTQTSDLNQLRNNIMAQFKEEDFESLVIQPKAAFIDSLLYDSKLKEYMNNSDLNTSNKSLLNKMKLYLPNELLISFLADSKAIEQIISIEEYLNSNDYHFISGSHIPTVKSKIKHYYFDKKNFEILKADLTANAQEIKFLKNENIQQGYLEIGLMAGVLLFVTLLIQLLDYYLLQVNLEETKFLLKGHIDPRLYHKQIIPLKSIILLVVFLLSLLYLTIDLASLLHFQLDNAFVIFMGLTSLTNFLIFFYKKERIEI